jgi:hypothetical protein
MTEQSESKRTRVVVSVDPGRPEPTEDLVAFLLGAISGLLVVLAILWAFQLLGVLTGGIW